MDAALQGSVVTPEPVVLLVGADPHLRSACDLAVLDRGWRTIEAASLPSLEGALRRHRPALVVTALERPDADARAVATALRREAASRPAPTWLVVSRVADPVVEAACLNLGADDYLVRPAPEPLIFARIRALARRVRASARGGRVLRDGRLVVRVDDRLATVAGRAIGASRREFDLLVVLLARRGRVLTREFLLETLWSSEQSGPAGRNTLKTHISSLRRRLGPGLGARIETLHGIGYRYRR